jgi:hypothetical protein
VIQKIILLRATHVFVGYHAWANVSHTFKCKAVANGSRKRLKAVHFGEHGDLETARFTGLESGENGGVSPPNCPQGRRRSLF